MQQNPYGAPQGNVGAPPMGGGGGQLSTGQHEFGQIENAAMTKAGGRTKRWGYVSLVLGAILLLASFAIFGVGAALPGPMAGGAVAALGVGTAALIQLATGWFYVQSGDRIESVATTQGNDVEHLMQGLDKLANAMRIEAIVTMVLFSLGFIAALVVGLS